MSASDSDCSIDWLASDDEDDDSALEGDVVRQRVRGTRSSPVASGEPCGMHPISKAQLRTSDSRCKADVQDGEHKLEGGSCGTNWKCMESCGGRVWAPPLLGQYGPSSPHGVERSPYIRPLTAQKRPHSWGVLDHSEQKLPSEMERNQLFSSKCMELQCYISPLSTILDGLRSGRYRGRLSSFQESVAMDRLQRIMGVLQNPGTGERYRNIVLKMEEMLKKWFPNVKPRDQHSHEETEETVSSKTRKMCPGTKSLPVLSTNPATCCTLCNGAMALCATEPCTVTNLKWLYTSPIGSPTTELDSGRRQLQPLPPPVGEDATQDSAISSSTDANPRTDVPLGRPPKGKINAPCLERLLRSTESIITRRNVGGTGSS